MIDAICRLIQFASIMINLKKLRMEISKKTTSKKAEDIIIDYKKRNNDILQLPIDIEKIALNHNIYIDFIGNNQSNYELSWLIKHGDKYLLTLYHPCFDNPFLKRFLVAHTIGHVLLNHDFSNMPIIENFSTIATGSVVSESDRQANEFALDLLMPRNQFILETQRQRNIIKKRGASSVKNNKLEESLANIFEVSEKHVTEKLNSI